VCAATSRSKKRKVKHISDPGDPPYLEPSSPTHTRVELDSHADTCAFGPACLILQSSGDTVTVEPFSSSCNVVPDVEICSLAVAYDCPTLFHTYILIFHQVLYIPSMRVHLINPFQLRDQGIEVNEVPLLHLDPNAIETTSHSIVSRDHELHIPLSLKGTMSGFTCRMPTWEEVNDVDQVKVTHVHMTSSDDWKPHSTTHSRLEDSLRESTQRGFDLYTRGSRDLYPLSHHQERGQVGDVAATDGAVLADDPVLELLSMSMSLGGNAPGASLGVDTVRDELKDNVSCIQGTQAYTTSTSKLMSLRLEQQHSPALDVDRYAEALLEELGVTEDPFEGTESSTIGAVSSVPKRKGFINAEKLAKNWRIGLEAAKRTVEATTQLAVRDFSHTTGGRRLKPYAWMLRYPRLEVPTYTDTFFAKTKSLRGNTCCQIYATSFHFVRVFPMARKKDAPDTLDDFFKQVGVPSVMIPDNAGELTSKEFKRKCRKVQCKVHPIEPYTPNANLAESVIRELKRMFRHTMSSTGAPEVLWDYCMEWCALVRSHTALNIHELNGQVPATRMTGDTVDISFLAEFGFYDWVWFITPQGDARLEETGTNSDSMSRKQLGRYLGPSINVGDAMCGSVFTHKATTLERTSIFPLSVEDLNSDVVKKTKQVFMNVLTEKLKDRVKALAEGKPPVSPEILEAQSEPWNDDEIPELVPYEEHHPNELGWDLPQDKPPLPEIAEADDYNLNTYVSAKVKLPRDGHTFATGRVVRRARDEFGELIGKSNDSPLLDSSVYEVEFEDGTVERYTANIIAEHIYSQIDNDGYSREVLDEIIDHKMDSTALPPDVASKAETTKGWWLLLRLKDQSTQWHKLKDLKESNPVEVAQYAVRNNLQDEPAFKWWVPYILRKTKRILKAMKKRYFRTHQKFGIELPKTIERALEIDRETGTTFWADAIKKEMGTVMKDCFQFLEHGVKPPPGHSFIGVHMVFDVKQGSLQRKARLVADGNRTEVTDVPTYASVVSSCCSQWIEHSWS